MLKTTAINHFLIFTFTSFISLWGHSLHICLCSPLSSSIIMVNEVNKRSQLVYHSSAYVLHHHNWGRGPSKTLVTWGSGVPKILLKSGDNPEKRGGVDVEMGA